MMTKELIFERCQPELSEKSHRPALCSAVPSDATFMPYFGDACE